MLRYIIRRILIAIPVLLVLSITVFTILRFTTDPLRSIVNPRMTPADIQRVKAAMGLDKSGPAQYTSWLTHFVQGDWGISIRRRTEVRPVILDRLGNTIRLMLLATLFSVVIAIAVGVYSAWRPYTALDYTFTGFSFFGISMPIFWFGLMLQLFLGLYLQRWLGWDQPLFFTGGMHRPGDPSFHLVDFLRHATLPSIALGVQLVAGWGRYERASMLEVMGADYMRTARAKGMRERSVILKHGLRNALIPLVTVLGIDVGALFGGLIITEGIFSWPGMGLLFVQSMLVGDYPIVLAWLMVTATFIVVFNLVADVVYAVLDPRIRYE
ncbi:MAG: ABC transporter permease [Actinomycetota bacterium]